MSPFPAQCNVRPNEKTLSLVKITQSPKSSALCQCTNFSAYLPTTLDLLEINLPTSHLEEIEFIQSKPFHNGLIAAYFPFTMSTCSPMFCCCKDMDLQIQKVAMFFKLDGVGPVNNSTFEAPAGTADTVSEWPSNLS